MPSSGATVEALISAFGFGIVVNAASAALFLYINGHGSSIFRDGQRLVLITFLLSSALWAQIDFVTTVFDTTATSACQIGILFTTFFDQLARFSIGQYLLWATNNVGKAGLQLLIPQGLIGVRFVMGMVFVGFSRPQFESVCVPISSMVAVSAIVIALDAVIIALMAYRAFATGLVRGVRGNERGAARGKSVLLVIVGFAIWTATSVTMLLGMKNMDLLLRTVIPSIGLLLLIFIITGCNGVLVFTRERPPRAPESPGARDIGTGRSLSTADSSDYPPSRYEDLKRGDVTSITAFIQPREAPKPATAIVKIPNVSRPVAVPIVDETPVQTRAIAPMRAATEPVPIEARRIDMQPRQKRSLFDLKGGPRTNITVAKVTISSPILEANGDQNPLNKIATIDLETAARNEKERRANDLQRASALIAKRPAPQPPSVPPEEAAKRAVSLRRKEVASVGSQPPGLPTDMDRRPSAATSSAMLSPGGEELRRRSPRQPPADIREVKPAGGAPPRPPRPESPPLVPMLDPLPSPTETTAATIMPEAVPVALPVAIPRAVSVAAPRAVPVAAPRIVPAAAPIVAPIAAPVTAAPAAAPEATGDGFRRVTIRPSRQLAPSPKTPPPEPVKTALQRRPTNGLPGNPRAMAMKASEVDAKAEAQRQQTIMFVNDIVYNDPEAVEGIISDASSVLNRPRPIPRKPEKDRGIFPAEPSPGTAGHRRSRSGGSIVTRKSILQSNPGGSPTQLPPLPPPPKSAANPQRPLPNDTKSMTFDEKMILMFPTPGTGGVGSSAPQLPPIPTNFMSLDSPTEGRMEGSRMSRSTNRTTKTSIKTDNIFEVDELPLVEPAGRRSEKGDHSIVDEVGSSWLPGIAPEGEIPVRQTMDSEPNKRASSPLLPPVRTSAMTESSDARTTNWGSVHSPVAAVPVQTTRRAARTTYIKGEKGDNRQTMTFMLDDSADQRRDARTSWFDDDNNNAATTSPPQRQWHRRVGDECPTFSGRTEKVRSRKMPPPAPLLLGPPSTKNPIIIKAAEPSPLESPQQALEFIQAQLRKFEGADGTAYESPGQRLRLLDNLEKEMDQQASHWQEIQHDMSRDSISTLRTSPDVESRRESMLSVKSIAREPSLKSTVAADRRAARRSRMRSGTTTQPVEDTAPIRSSTENTNASALQRRLAEVQSGYADKAGSSQRAAQRNNKNTISMAQLGSPTPPDSDDSEVERELRRPRKIDTVAAQASRKEIRKSLWTPADHIKTPSTSMLWTPGPQTPDGKRDAAQLPSLGVRPPARKDSTPLDIQSTELWRKSRSAEKESNSGLWEPSHAKAKPAGLSTRQSQPEPEPESQSDMELDSELDRQYQATQDSQSQRPPRPLTQRPPRRSKRVTLLPDILESPEPLPDKRGTLGIFQFPWGERSDTATVQPRGTMFMAMPGTMTSGGQTVNAALEARARQLEAAEYSSSFFDDYDDDDEVADSDEDASDGDDGFDENTLWEIASLLKTEQVPSKASLFPPPISRAVEEYITEMPSDGEEEDEVHREEIFVAIEEEDTVPGAAQSKPDASVAQKSNKLWGAAQKEQSALWTSKQSASAKTSTGSQGIAQPDDSTWKDYDRTQETARAKPRKAQAAEIESETLWEASDAKEDHEPSGMWTAKATKPTIGLMRKNSKEKAKKASKTVLWAPPSTPVAVPNAGMFKVELKKTEDRRTTSEDPAAVDMVRRPRTPELKPLEQLTSTGMWTSSDKAPTTGRNWITEKAPVPEPVVVDDTINATNVGIKQPTWWEKMKNSLGVNNSAAAPASGPGSSTASANLPLRYQHRVNVAVHGAWDAALREAVAASYPPIPRPKATPGMWHAALTEAISRSRPYDPSRTHPVFAAAAASSSLITKSEWFHPAATGYTYDPANIHPVFFGSLDVTCDLEHVHPAMGELALAKVRHDQRGRRGRTASRGRSMSRSLSRSDSRSKRREHIKAHIRALMDGPADASADPTVPTVPVFSPDDTDDDAMSVRSNTTATTVTTTATTSAADAIRAQVEALEREREFAEQAMMRMVTSAAAAGASSYPPPPPPPAPVAAKPAAPVVAPQPVARPEPADEGTAIRAHLESLERAALRRAELLEEGVRQDRSQGGSRGGGVQLIY